jgi:hypothetical protein
VRLDDAAADREPQADAYLMVQDDALFYDREDLREYLEAALWPDGPVGAVSLYCPMAYTQPRSGWHRHEGHQSSRTQRVGQPGAAQRLAGVIAGRAGRTTVRMRMWNQPSTAEPISVWWSSTRRHRRTQSGCDR